MDSLLRRAQERFPDLKSSVEHKTSQEFELLTGESGRGSCKKTTQTYVITQSFKSKSILANIQDGGLEQEKTSTTLVPVLFPSII